MEQPPSWYKPVTIVALLWNLLGCFAYLADVMLSPEAVAKMTEAQQALYHARPGWSVGATAVAVWFGAAGSLGLILRKQWAMTPLVLSLLGIIAQDVWLFGMSGAGADAIKVAVVLQGLVLVIGVVLLLLARKATARGWLA